MHTVFKQSIVYFVIDVAVMEVEIIVVTFFHDEIKRSAADLFVIENFLRAVIKIGFAVLRVIVDTINNL